ncbi:MAG: hypothetical protein H7210_09815 [Pyrinomonadaceae bacterium]|nr:hypothetical protein [Phycisphaerales bacterium]
MVAARGFSLTDLAGVTAASVVAAAILLAMAPEPHGPLPITLNNLRVIGQATSGYQADHNNYLPMVLSYVRGSTPASGGGLEGWCTWSFGGKNNHGYWGGRAFDVEAADRPLNPYVIPDEYFYAPPRPTRLPNNHPARTHAQAPMFQDPGDIATHQRNWPAATPGVSAYNDIGTSYQTNASWWNQVPQNLPFVARFNEGTRRIAVGKGVQPSRFVWLSDEFSTLVLNNPNRRFRLTNGYGDVNYAPMLFMDGHVLYDRITPTIFSTSRYTFIFEP